MTANHEYSRSKRENLPLPIQMQLSKKPNIFLLVVYYIFGICITFWKIWNKNERHSLSVSEVIDSERRAYLNT